MVAIIENEYFPILKDNLKDFIELFDTFVDFVHVPYYNL